MLSEKQKYDPWEVKQEIAPLKITVHCARYWMLSEWESSNLSLPFWRLYHSRTGGGFIVYRGETIEVGAQQLWLIAPNTSFAGFLQAPTSVESIRGVRIQSVDEVAKYKAIGMIDQLFIHFSLGYPYDNIRPGVYGIELTGAEEDNLRALEEMRLTNPNQIEFSESVRLHQLLLMALTHIPQEQWQFPPLDARVLKVIKYIDKNLKKELTNAELARVANMATNSFARLFREQKQLTLKQYIQLCRVEKSVMCLLHTNEAIDLIAQECGYFDRHHFSKVFKSVTGMAPALYRKKMSGESVGSV